MAYYDALIAKYPSVTGTDTPTKITNLNALTAAGPAVTMLVATYKIYNLIVAAEFNALTAANQQLVRDILGMGTVDASPGTAVRSRIVSIFPNGTTTFSNLSTLAATYDSPQVPWWQANGYTRPFHKGDIVEAGLDTTTGYSAVISSPTTNKFNVSVTVTVTGPRTQETDTTFGGTLTTDAAKVFAANAVYNMMVRDGSLTTFGV